MKNTTAKSISFLLVGVMTTAAWAAGSPIGALTIEGKATITAQDTSFTLQNQEYAYFSGDRVETSENSQASVTMNDGLKLGLTGSSVVTIAQNGDSYSINLEQGHLVVSAVDGADYEITHNGQAVSPDKGFNPSEEPYVASVMDDGRVQFYLPAQLDEENNNILNDPGITPEVVAIITGATALLHKNGGGTNDDTEPGS